MKTYKNSTSLIFLSLLFTIFFSIDLFSKYLIVNSSKLPFKITSFFQLVFEKNTGIAFSIQLPVNSLLLVNFILILVIVVFILLKINFKKPLSLLIISLLLAGACGNFYDRLFYGYVIDFISIGNFPIFNFADAFISVSIFILIIFYDRIKKDI